MTLQTGGFALGVTSTKSRSASFAISSASFILTTPRFSPSTPINLTSGVLILLLSLVYLSELILLSYYILSYYYFLLINLVIKSSTLINSCSVPSYSLTDILPDDTSLSPIITTYGTFAIISSRIL